MILRIEELKELLSNNALPINIQKMEMVELSKGATRKVKMIKSNKINTKYYECYKCYKLISQVL